jgi:uncharacterized protein (TIGR02271 family)
MPADRAMQDKPRDERNVEAKTTAERRSNPAEENEVVIPVVAEELSVDKSRVARGVVRVNKRIETRDETVNVPLVHEDVIVEHINVNQIVEGQAPQARQEGDVLIIPVLEEVAVVETRLMLREEVRVSRRRSTTNTPQVVTLRREVADIERVDADQTALPPASASKKEMR